MAERSSRVRAHASPGTGGAAARTPPGETPGRADHPEPDENRKLEDESDLAAIEAAKAEPSLPWKRVKAKLGL